MSAATADATTTASVANKPGSLKNGSGVPETLEKHKRLKSAQ